MNEIVGWQMHESHLRDVQGLSTWAKWKDGHFEFSTLPPKHAYNGERDWADVWYARDQRGPLQTLKALTVDPNSVYRHFWSMSGLGGSMTHISVQA